MTKTLAPNLPSLSSSFFVGKSYEVSRVIAFSYTILSDMHREDAITTIRLLSLCLRGRKVPPSDELQEDIIRSRILASVKEDHQLSLLGHLLTMLDTGSRPELFPAVTSEVMKDAVLLTVVVSSGSDAHIQLQATPPPSTTTEIIPNSMSLENINNPLM